MAEFPALTLWTDAYLSDTRRLTTLEHGAYLLLLMEAWRRPNCDLPDDDRLLARMAGLPEAEWADIKPIIMAFWKFDGRGKVWKQKRLTKERDAARNRSKSQRDKATKRWDKTKNGDAGASAGQSPDDASTVTVTVTANIEEGSEANASAAEDGVKPLPEAPPETPPLTAVDLTKAVFDTGRRILAAAGKTDAQARAMLGKWRQTYRDGPVLNVLARCEVERPEAPIPWITAALQTESRLQGSSGHERTFPNERRGVAELAFDVANELDDADAWRSQNR